MKRKLMKWYYYLRPLLPRRMQIYLRREYVSRVGKFTQSWPISNEAGVKPANWPGWPEQKNFAFVLMHDVETKKGYAHCQELMNLELEFGFRSSFNFVPERYEIQPGLREQLMSCGFEVGVQGLRHDGKLYNSYQMFQRRAVAINRYIKEWQASGFRSPAMHHNLDWIHILDIEYDSSTFDTDPFEPQSNGIRKIFPFSVNGSSGQKKYIELPYTLPQDFTLFILLKEKSIDIWRKKLDWIAQQGGMALLTAHPDYMNFTDRKNKIDEYSVSLYCEFLEYVKSTYQNQYWHALPREVARFWRSLEI